MVLTGWEKGGFVLFVRWGRRDLWKSLDLQPFVSRKQAPGAMFPGLVFRIAASDPFFAAVPA